MKLKTRLFLLFFSLWIPSAGALTPATISPDDQELIYEGIPYACTGVAESKEYPQWRSYPLKLVFTASGRAYVADVQVRMMDADKKEILKVTCGSPWLLVKLPSGSYTVEAQAQGTSVQKAEVVVPKLGQTERVIRFSSIQGE